MSGRSGYAARSNYVPLRRSFEGTFRSVLDKQIFPFRDPCPPRKFMRNWEHARREVIQFCINPTGPARWLTAKGPLGVGGKDTCTRLPLAPASRGPRWESTLQPVDRTEWSPAESQQRHHVIRGRISPPARHCRNWVTEDWAGETFPGPSLSDVVRRIYVLTDRHGARSAMSSGADRRAVPLSAHSRRGRHRQFHALNLRKEGVEFGTGQSLRNK